MIIYKPLNLKFVNRLEAKRYFGHKDGHLYRKIFKINRIVETTFKYKNTIITTPNLEKKLKRMKLTLNDIEIIETPKKKEELSGLEDYMKSQVIVCSTEDDIRRICYIDINKGLPPISELFKNQIWNPETKTGLYTKEFLMTMYYEKVNSPAL